MRQKFIPKLQWAVLVDTGEPRGEVFLESCDSTLGGVDSMVVGGDKVNIHIIFVNVCLDGFGTFVVHHVERGVIIAGGKGGKDVSEGGDHGAIILGGHCTHKDGIEVVDICHKNILHRPEGADGKGTGKIGVHGARREVGKCSEAEDVVGAAYFFGGKQIVNLAACVEDGWLRRSRGSGALPVAAHMAFVGGC